MIIFIFIFKFIYIISLNMIYGNINIFKNFILFQFSFLQEVYTFYSINIYRLYKF